ncbi:uncharacterized protein LOC129716712 [Wyeomyia smithii]|uniref:uncharacterized protein LOC129716712 n=1 Tax=Wyeomyia smithii TaxID=174621 RepID=UPI002467E02A|nr:uncharacterized protein LOC129716712 [Wyeomyia smithii]
MRTFVDGGNLRVSTRGEYLSRDVINESGIQIAYQNVRGLRTKIDELFLATRDCNLDIIILTETGLDDRINSNQLFGSSFNVFRCDRSSQNSNKSSFGGVLIAVAHCHASSLIETVNGNCLEQVCVSTTIRGTKLLLCGVYIPPDRSHKVDVIEKHIASVGELYDKRGDNSIVLICGDFNQPRLEWTVDSAVISAHLPAASATLVDGMDFYNLCQTNLQRNHLGRILDLVFCPSDCRVSTERSVVPLLPVDLHHPPLTITLPVTCSSDIARARVEVGNRSLNYRRIDFAALSDYLLNFDWESLLTCTDIDELTHRFCDVIVQWLHSNLPFVKRPNSPAWGTLWLRELKRLKNSSQRKYRRLKTALTKSDFKRHSDEYRRLNRTLYRSYVLRVQTDLRRNPRNFWNFVNTKRKCSSVPVNVRFDNDESTSESESCELFAKFFASVFADEAASDSEAESAASGVPPGLVDLSTFTITTDMVLMEFLLLFLVVVLPLLLFRYATFLTSLLRKESFLQFGSSR